MITELTTRWRPIVNVSYRSSQDLISSGFATFCGPSLVINDTTFAGSEMNQPNGYQSVQCPDCGGADCRSLGRLPQTELFAGRQVGLQLGAGSLYACNNCALKFRFPRIEAGEYLALYEEVAAAHWSNEDRPDFAIVMGHVRRHLPVGGRVLDVGCHTGGLLEALGQDYELYGVEPNPAAGRIAIARGARAVWRGFDEIPDGRLFDAVVTCDVIEHVISPRVFLDRLLSYLAPGGIVIIATGNSDSTLARISGPRWWYCFYAEHISFVSDRWLSEIAAERSLDVVRVDHFCHEPAQGMGWLKQAVMSYSYALVPALVKSMGTVFGSRAFVDWPVGDGVSKDHLCAVLRAPVPRENFLSNGNT